MTQWTIARLPTKQFPIRQTCDTGPLSSRNVPDWFSIDGNDTDPLTSPLVGRGITIGPPVHLSDLLSCPNDGTTATDCQKLVGLDPGDDEDDDSDFSKRDSLGLHQWEKREPKVATVCNQEVILSYTCSMLNIVLTILYTPRF